MKPNPEIGQGRNGDVPMPAMDRELVVVMVCSAVFVLLIITGVVFLGPKFLAGLVLMGVGLGSFACWALGKGAPW